MQIEAVSRILPNNQARKTHIAGPGFKPLCGGARNGKSSNWQREIGGLQFVDCLKCLRALTKQITRHAESVKASGGGRLRLN